MGKELNFFQTLSFWSLAVFLFVRGSGFTWLVLKVTEKDGKIEKLIYFINNDMYATMITISLLILIYLLGKNNSWLKKITDGLFGRRNHI